MKNHKLHNEPVIINDKLDLEDVALKARCSTTKFTVRLIPLNLQYT